MFDSSGCLYKLAGVLHLDPRLADFPIARPRKYVLLVLRGQVEFPGVQPDSNFLSSSCDPQSCVLSCQGCAMISKSSPLYVSIPV